jgi:hypothetical protein
MVVQICNRRRLRQEDPMFKANLGYIAKNQTNLRVKSSFGCCKTGTLIQLNPGY